MKKSRDTEEQIIGILKQGEAGMKTADLCREHGISAETLYGWKQKFGGMDVSEAHRLKALEDENRYPSFSPHVAVWRQRLHSSASMQGLLHRRKMILSAIRLRPRAIASQKSRPEVEVVVIASSWLLQADLWPRRFHVCYGRRIT